jgi:prevent-host-death family protein
MNGNEIPYRDLRASLANVLNRIEYRNETFVITRRGKPVAAIVPLDRIKEPAVTDTTYTASIGLISSVVTGDFCDLAVNEDQIVAAREDDYGNEIPVTEPTGPMVLDTVELGDARTDDPDSESKAYDAADEMLDDHGWRRVGPWNAAAGDAAYAPVERA